MKIYVMYEEFTYNEYSNIEIIHVGTKKNEIWDFYTNYNKIGEITIEIWEDGHYIKGVYRYNEIEKEFYKPKLY